MPKIKILAAPQEKMAMGGTQRPPKQGPYAGQSGWALNTGQRFFDPTFSTKDDFAVNDSIKSVPRDEANMEVEAGETITRPNADGSLAMFDINGKKHYEGGEPILGKAGDYVFSDFKKLAIGGEILGNFGKNPDTKQKFTPAQLSKQYDLNKLNAIINNPDLDKLQKDTAERMITGRTKKLQELAVIAEAMKGFPQGMPELMGNNEKGIPQAKFSGRFQIGGKFDVPQWIDNSNNTESTNNPQIGSLDPYTVSAKRKVQIVEVPQSELQPFTNTQSTQEDATPVDFSQFAATPTQNNPGINPAAGQISTTTYRPPYGISNGDRLNMLANAAIPPRQGMPIRSNPRVSIPGVVLPDERAAIAAQQSAGTSAMNANAITGDGARVRASNTGITGKLLEGLQGIEGQTAGERAKILNEANRYAAEAQSKQSFATQEANQQYNQQTDTARFNYDQSKRNYFNTLAKDASQAQKNAAQLSWINSMHNNSPYYIDPKTGRPSYNPNYVADLTGPGGASDSGYGAHVKAAYEDLKKQFPNMDEGELQKQAFAIVHTQRTRSTTNPYQPGKGKYTQSGSPYYSENTYDPIQAYTAGYQ